MSKETAKKICTNCAFEAQDEEGYRECDHQDVGKLDYTDRCRQMEMADEEKCNFWKAAYHLIKHVGLRAFRLEEPLKYSLRERAFAEVWKEENTRQSYINHGAARLEMLLTPDDKTETKKRWSFWSGIMVKELTQNDAEVAATVIQWLGTNNGQAFLYKVDLRIKELQGKIKDKSE